MEFEQQGHGIVGAIRSTTSSEQFDLSGYTESRTHDVLTGAFGKPLEAPTEMIKFTFIVGGGKLVRSRYPDELPKWVSNSLREIGFLEDRSAALDLSSQGTFKLQHDTGQNLKVIIVFPHVMCGQAKTSLVQVSSSSTGIDVNSKEYLILSTELDTFKEMINHKVESWTLKKRVLKILQDARIRFEELEQKLVQGALLTPDEQLVYDSNPTSDQDKITWLQGEIKEMVDKGRLTQVEKAQLLESLKTNIDTIDAEIEVAKTEQKLKKVEKLEERKLNMQSRKAAVDAISPVSFPLKFASEIHSLICRLQPLLALEEKGRSMSLTLADLKTLEEKSDIERGLAEYEQASR
jgi:polyhydroxyalkanoate synthesis regulator phasin